MDAPAASAASGSPQGIPGPQAADEASGRPLDYLGTARYQRFWPDQEIFALPTFSDTHLRVNVAGREGHGVVDRRRYDSVLDRWEERLRALRDGRTAARRWPTSCAPGPATPSASGPPADLVVRFARPADLLEDRDQGRLGPLPFLRTGEHGPTGFVRIHDPRGPVRLARRVDPGELGDLLRDLLGDVTGPELT